MLNFVEFYVIAFAVAVSLVVLMMRPAEKGEARTGFACGEMSDSEAETPVLEVTGSRHGLLSVVRRGVVLDTLDCSVNYGYTIIGNDIKIIERRVDDKITELNGRTVDIRFSLPEELRGRYHLYFESEWSGQWASGYLSIPSDYTKSLEIHL